MLVHHAMRDDAAGASGHGSPDGSEWGRWILENVGM
jgi:hypothetical protein